MCECVRSVCVFSVECCSINVPCCVFVFVICSRISSPSLSAHTHRAQGTAQQTQNGTASVLCVAPPPKLNTWLQRDVCLDAASTCCTNININQLTISTSNNDVGRATKGASSLRGRSSRRSLKSTICGSCCCCCCLSDKIARWLLLGASRK